MKTKPDGATHKDSCHYWRHSGTSWQVHDDYDWVNAVPMAMLEPLQPEWPESNERIDAIGLNGPTGLHYMLDDYERDGLRHAEMS